MFARMLPRRREESMPRDPVREETERLAQFAVYHALEPPPWFGVSQTELCLRNCMARMLDRHSMVFGGMMVRLNIDRNVDFREGFREVAEELFKDAITWSKIVALFAFGARLAQHCRENPSLVGLVEDVATSLSEFAGRTVRVSCGRVWVGWQSCWALLPSSSHSRGRHKFTQSSFSKAPTCVPEFKPASDTCKCI